MNAPETPRKGHRLWILVVILLLTAGGIIATILQPELDRNFKSWGVSVLSLLGGILVMLWFLLLSRYSGKVRLVVAGIVLLVGFGVSRSVRVDGTVDGRGLPKLAWKWSKDAERHFAASTETAAAEVAKAEGAADVPRDEREAPARVACSGGACGLGWRGGWSRADDRWSRESGGTDIVGSWVKRLSQH